MTASPLARDPVRAQPRRAAAPTPSPAVDRLSPARRREHSAALRLAEALMRLEQAHAAAVHRQAVLDALVDAAKAALRRDGYLAGSSLS